jgi:transposase
LAIVQASQLIDIRFIRGKTFSQQELQSINKMRELAVRQKVALNNQIKALLLEFTIRISPRKGGMSGVVQHVLEEADNGFSSAFRQALNSTWQALLDIIRRISGDEDNLRKMINDNPDCKKLLALEGVSTINAVHLYTALACNDENQFQTGRDASACIGLTPIHYSSGGKIKLGSIGKYVKNTF